MRATVALPATIEACLALKAADGLTVGWILYQAYNADQSEPQWRRARRLAESRMVG